MSIGVAFLIDKLPDGNFDWTAILEAMNLPYIPNEDDGDEMSDTVMVIPVADGILRRWEDGSAFFFPGGEEGVRISWGRFDPMNPEYDKNMFLARQERGRQGFSCG